MSYSKKTADAAQGLVPAETVLKNGNVVNVFTGEITTCDVAITSGVIVGVGDYSGETEIDMSGKYICPGFIDGHLHLESCMVSPDQLVRRAAAYGTTTFIVDPHEVANVSGSAGIDFMLDSVADAPANVYFMMPSCVPSTKNEDNGATFDADEMKKYLKNPSVLGLGEVMDFVSVLGCDETMLDKLKLFSDKTIDGHAGFLNDKQLSAYALAGIRTDHECCDYETAMRERRSGLHIMIREGSAAKNLNAIVSGIVVNSTDTDGFSFCTDDKHIEDIQREGHINYNIRRAVKLGLDAVSAIKMATINTARCYNLRHIGAVAPGYQADIVILDSLDNLNVCGVYHKGAAVTRDDSVPNIKVDPKLKHTVNIKEFNESQLEIKADGTPQTVIGLVEGQILTKRMQSVLPFDNGMFIPNREFNKAVVIERHKATGKVSAAPLAGFGISGGAIASTVSHDSHNMTIIGDNDRDIMLAADELVRVQGGFTIVQNGAMAATLPLSIMGLISENSCGEVDKKLAEMVKLAHEMGVSGGVDPFITMAFIALAVIPEIRITTRGIFDVVENKFLNQ